MDLCQFTEKHCVLIKVLQPVIVFFACRIVILGLLVFLRLDVHRSPEIILINLPLLTLIVGRDHQSYRL